MQILSDQHGQISHLGERDCSIQLAWQQAPVSTPSASRPAVRPRPRGYAVQLRVNTELLLPDGTAAARTGMLAAFRPPDGPGVRVDTHGYEGYRTSGL